MLINTRHKILRILAALTVLIIHMGVLTTQVNAATSVEITITAFPLLFSAPTEFTVTVIDDNHVQLDWTMHPLASATIIKQKVGAYPMDVDDGTTVYNGIAETADDTTIDLDENASIVYYRAWSLDGDGNESPDYAEGDTGDRMSLIANAIIFIAILFVIAALNALAFKERHIFIYSLMTPVDLTYGLYYAGTATERYEWVIGIVVAIIGMFCLGRAVMMGLSSSTGRRPGVRE